MLVDFCLPVRNEEKILVSNVERLKKFLCSWRCSFDWQITIIVNGSNDNSENLSRDLQQSYPTKIKVLVLAAGGKGLAIKECFHQSQGDILIFMDIDLAVDLNYLPNLITPVVKGKYDLVFGSRLLPGSQTERSWIREISSRSYNMLSRLILNHHFYDLQCGFKAVRRETFSKVSPWLRDNHWFFDTELIILSKKFNYRLLEIPVNWQENRYDQRISKIRTIRDSLPFIRNLLLFKKFLKKVK